jgi:hypothetical protein
MSIYTHQSYLSLTSLSLSLSRLEFVRKSVSTREVIHTIDFQFASRSSFDLFIFNAMRYIKLFLSLPLSTSRLRSLSIPSKAITVWNEGEREV